MKSKKRDVPLFCESLKSSHKISLSWSTMDVAELIPNMRIRIQGGMVPSRGCSNPGSNNPGLAVRNPRRQGEGGTGGSAGSARPWTHRPPMASVQASQVGAWKQPLLERYGDFIQDRQDARRERKYAYNQEKPHSTLGKTPWRRSILAGASCT
jgi:hypothetical protein